MQVTLTKMMIIHMVKGTTPSYELMGDPTIAFMGTFNGSYGTWQWDETKMRRSSVEQLFAVYQLLVS